MLALGAARPTCSSRKQQSLRWTAPAALFARARNASIFSWLTTCGSTTNPRTVWAPRGAGATVAVSHAAGTDGQNEHARGLRHLLELTIGGVLTWMGLVNLIQPSAPGSAMQITPALREIVRAEAGSIATPAAGTRIAIADDLTIRLIDPEPIHVWSLLAFAQPVSLAAESVFRITADRVRAAQGAGFRPDQIVQYVRRQKPEAIPDDFDERIRQLAEDAPGIELTTSLALDLGRDVISREVRSLLESAGYVVSAEGQRLYATIGTLRPVRLDVERIHALLESSGFGPVSNRSRH